MLTGIMEKGQQLLTMRNQGEKEIEQSKNKVLSAVTKKFMNTFVCTNSVRAKKTHIHITTHHLPLSGC